MSRGADSNGIHHIYGPVPSRRLGRSLGVDIVPYKVCTLDCVYCQLGRTTERTTARRAFGDVGQILAELDARLADGVDADYITIGGSGEPTLNSQLGAVVSGVRRITDVPTAILTNGTLLYDPAVRTDCALADVVLPSLDAADDATFNSVNRPSGDISIENVVSGLCAFRDMFRGRIWLEVLFVEGINTSDEQVEKLHRAIERINPDKVHVNTVVRPPADRGVKAVDPSKLAQIAALLWPGAEVIAEHEDRRRISTVSHERADVLSMLKRRPCSIEQICTALKLDRDDAQRLLGRLLDKGLTVRVKLGGQDFYRSAKTQS